MASLLRIANIKKEYKISPSLVQQVLKGITLDFNGGEFVALLGESGSGKSTLLNIIGGLDNEYAGSVSYKGKYMSDYTDEDIDLYRRQKIGFIFQNYNLIAHMTAFDNVAIALSLSGFSEEVRNERTTELLKLVGLLHEKDKLPNQLSGGQKQRIAIARALANNPSIIIGDEPTGALDKESADAIFEILERIAKMGKLVLLVTHSHELASKCSRVVTISEGVVVSDKVVTPVKIKDNVVEGTATEGLSTKDNFKLSLGNVLRNKSRNILVSVGLSISIILMILILQLSKGLMNYVSDLYSSDGVSNKIMVYNSDYSSVTSDLDDIYDIDIISSVIEANVILNASSVNSSDESTSITQVFEYESGYAPDILYGDTVTTYYQIIVNEDYAMAISDETMLEAVGQSVTISYGGSDVEVEIVGIYANTHDDSYTQYNVYIDEYSMNSLTSASTNLLYVKISDVSYLTDVIEALEELGLTTYQQDTSAQDVMEYIELGTSVLTGISIAAMVVGAIMIFVVLYLSIVERTKEIGVLRAIGARKKDIKNMFIFESLIIGGISGIIGIVFCVTLSIITNITTQFLMDANIMAYNILNYLLGLFVSIFISVVSGLSPSIKASMLDPVESLRYE